MKTIPLIVLFGLLCGCHSLDVEKLSKQLSENNASFTLSVERNKLTISRVNPPIGFNAVVLTNGIQQTSPPGMSIGVMQHVHSVTTNPFPAYIKVQPSTNVVTQP